MNNVLLLVPPACASSKAVRRALGLAKARSAKLIVSIALDPELTQKVSDRFTEVGFMGEKIGDQVSQTISQDHSMRGSSLLTEVAELAKKEQVDCETSVEISDPAEIASRAVREKGVSAVLLLTEKRSWLSRFLKGSQPFRLPHLEGCEVTVLEED